MTAITARMPRRALLLATALVLAAAGLVATTGAAPAHATIAQCTPPTNGFVNPINGDNAHVVRYFNAIGTTTSLQWKYLNGRQVVFAYLGGDTFPYDRVWMDWSRNGGLTWIQCGPFTVQNLHQGRRTYAQRTTTDPRWIMRACSRLSGEEISRCTPWW
jgi:hypothetical protein